MRGVKQRAIDSRAAREWRASALARILFPREEPLARANLRGAMKVRANNGNNDVMASRPAAVKFAKITASFAAKGRTARTRKPRRSRRFFLLRAPITGSLSLYIYIYIYTRRNAGKSVAYTAWMVAG